MKPSELPGARRLYRLTTRALAQIKELWHYAGEDELPPDSLLQAHVEALRILHINVPLSAKRQFQLFCSEHFPGLADILDCLAADQLWALLSMRVQLAVSDQPHAQSAAVRFGGLGRRYVLVAFDDHPVGPLWRRRKTRFTRPSNPMTSILLSGYRSRRRADNRQRQSLRIAPQALPESLRLPLGRISDLLKILLAYFTFSWKKDLHVVAGDLSGTNDIAGSTRMVAWVDRGA